MHSVASELVVCFLERITTLCGFYNSNRNYTKSTKGKKKKACVLGIVCYILHLLFFQLR